MTARDLTLMALFAVLTAVCAQISLVLPVVTSVPFTLQVFGVLVAGAVLGARRGFISQLVYLLLGVAGLPVFARFAGGLPALVGPTAGYLWAFPLAAGVTGLAADWTGRNERGLAVLLTQYAGMLAGIVLIYAGGVFGLWVAGVAPTIGAAARIGILPFLWFDLVKVVVAGLVATRLSRVLR